MPLALTAGRPVAWGSLPYRGHALEWPAASQPGYADALVRSRLDRFSHGRATTILSASSRVATASIDLQRGFAAQVPDSLRCQTVNGMDENKPELAIGHIVMHVADAVKSAEFYSKLGLRIVAKQPRMSLVELLGGTHILLSDEKAAWENMRASRIGAKAPDRKEDFELMISGGSREDLEEYRDSLGKRGLAPKPIEDEMYHGHYVFQIDDPDGNTVTIYTSHAIGPV